MFLTRQPMTRRTLLKGGIWAAVSAVCPSRTTGETADGGAAEGAATGDPTSQPAPPIDRRSVVGRHNVRRSRSVARSPLQVGNGTIAFGADVTGLQTFVPHNTLSQWGWHTAPLPDGQALDDMADVVWPGPGRGIPYDSGDPHHPQITAWAFANPSRVNLGRIGLKLFRADGTVATEDDLSDVRQELDLWTGTLRSHFALDGRAVSVTTACHPEQDAIAVRVESTALAAGRASAYLDFPAPDNRQLAEHVGTGVRPGRFPIIVATEGASRIDLIRELDQDRYHVAVAWNAGTTLHHPHEPGARRPTIAVHRARFGSATGWVDVTAVVVEGVRRGDPEITATVAALGSDPPAAKRRRLEVTYTVDRVERSDEVDENNTWAPDELGGPNAFRLSGTGTALEFLVAFAPGPIPADLPDVAATFAAAASHWRAFWQSGGAIDLSASADPRWHELERRVVLSQYLMAVNEAGDLPPQESGLVNTGWFGKFHMEMYWWHAAHYALWNRWQPLEKSLDVYERMLPSAEARAARQGFKGARWTKMTGPEFRNSTVSTNALLVWQQPHPMFFAELAYRAKPERRTLEKWHPVLSDAADFMASYATRNPATGKLDLGPSLAPVSENTDYKVTTNPTFELSYWRFGLRIANVWRERLGLPRDPAWDRVLHGLAPLPVADGVYETYQGIPDMWTHYNFEHPALLGAFGWLPGDGVDIGVMRATFDRVLAKWRMNKVWGWDFPMMAMCAARLGLPDRAVDLLLSPGGHFDFDDAGLATGGPFPYFPSNGGLLYAVAMMAAGWVGSLPGRSAPGFPPGGGWVVRWEGLSRAI
jgi:hypothetical protein